MLIDDEDVIISFGKFKGKRMGDLPLSYLKWLAETISEEDLFHKNICLVADRLYQSRKD